MGRSLMRQKAHLLSSDHGCYLSIHNSDRQTRPNGLQCAQWDWYRSIPLTSFQASLVKDIACVVLQESSDHGRYLLVKKVYIQTSSGSLWHARRDCYWLFYLNSFFSISKRRPCFCSSSEVRWQWWQMDKARWQMDKVILIDNGDKWTRLGGLQHARHDYYWQIYSISFMNIIIALQVFGGHDIYSSTNKDDKRTRLDNMRLAQHDYYRPDLFKFISSKQGQQVGRQMACMLGLLLAQSIQPHFWASLVEDPACAALLKNTRTLGVFWEMREM